MRLKLDENIDVRLLKLFTDRGHSAATVHGEGVSGAPDSSLYERCLAEGRVLVTLDLDFSNPIRFPPAATEGIIVLRPSRPVLSLVAETVKSVLGQLDKESIRGRLWIIEPGRMRVYDPSGESE